MAFLSGGFVGVLLGATGGGGSLVAIPLLVYAVGVPVQNATAMSLVVVGYSSLFGAWKESRKQQVHGVTALLFSPTGMFGAWVGAHGHRLVPELLVLFIFGHLLLLISMWTFWKSHEGEQNESPTGCAREFSGHCVLKALAFGWGVGLVTGFFGVGGGFVIVPILMLLMGFPIRLAIGTSLLIIALISIGGVFGHLKVTRLDWGLTGLVLLGSLLGLMFGSTATRAIPARHLVRGFSLLIGLIGVLLIVANGWQFLL